MRFDEILTAHGFMRTERPPLMWEADTNDERFIPLLGEMIVVGLNAGNELAQLTLAVSNVTVEEDEDPEETPWVEPGDYVAVTVQGPGRWSDDVWRSGDGPTVPTISPVSRSSTTHSPKPSSRYRSRFR